MQYNAKYRRPRQTSRTRVRPVAATLLTVSVLLAGLFLGPDTVEQPSSADEERQLAAEAASRAGRPAPPGRSVPGRLPWPRVTATVQPSPTPSPDPTPSEDSEQSATPSPGPDESPDDDGPSDEPNEPSDPPQDEEPPAPEPDTGDFPNANTTGVPDGVELERSGSITVTEDGTVIDAVDVHGTIKVEANDVTIKRSRIVSGGRYPIFLEPGYTGLLVEDTEIDGNGQSSVAILYRGYTLRRVNIHGVDDGPRIEGDNVLIEESYIHHLHRVEGGHHDVLQMRQGSNVVVRNNNLQAYNPDTDDPMNAAIQFGSALGPIDDVLFEGNLMNGGNVTVNGGGLTGGTVTFRHNRFGRDFRYGVLSDGPGLVWESSNVFDDNGEPAP